MNNFVCGGGIEENIMFFELHSFWMVREGGDRKGLNFINLKQKEEKS